MVKAVYSRYHELNPSFEIEICDSFAEAMIYLRNVKDPGRCWPLCIVDGEKVSPNKMSVTKDVLQALEVLQIEYSFMEDAIEI